MKLEDIKNLLLCSECENKLRVESYLEGKPFFSVQPCVHCTNTDTSESQPVRESVPGNAMKSTFELRVAAKAVYSAMDEELADPLSALLNIAADKIEELERESEPMEFEKLRYGCPWFQNGNHHDDPSQNEAHICRATNEECMDDDCAPFFWATGGDKT